MLTKWQNKYSVEKKNNKKTLKLVLHNFVKFWEYYILEQQ